MKNTLYIVLVAGLMACNNKQEGNNFEIEGTIKNTTANKIYLEENVPNGQPVIIDSAEIKNGAFQLKAGSREESFYHLRLGGKMTPFAFLINDASKVKIQADPDNTAQPYTVEGSTASQTLISFDRTTYEKGMALFNLGSKVDSLRRAQATDSIINMEYAKVEAAANSLKSYASEVLTKANSPVLILYVLSSFQNTAANLGLPGFTKTEIADIINSAASKFPQHTALQNVKKNMLAAETEQKKSNPTQAMEFSQPGVDGKPVSLASFRGKYVLLDFWASWCKPCRLENPNVVKAYQEFKDKNFTVFGVSLDQQKEAWLKAIQQDGLTWTHASDLKYWENAAAVLYGVQSIPANYLIDPQGNIIARDLHGDDLMNTLRHVIK